LGEKVNQDWLVGFLFFRGFEDQQGESSARLHCEATKNKNTNHHHGHAPRHANLPQLIAAQSQRETILNSIFATCFHS
jgi:hypothetical protein